MDGSAKKPSQLYYGNYPSDYHFTSGGDARFTGLTSGGPSSTASMNKDDFVSKLLTTGSSENSDIDNLNDNFTCIPAESKLTSYLNPISSNTSLSSGNTIKLVNNSKLSVSSGISGLVTNSLNNNLNHNHDLNRQLNAMNIDDQTNRRTKHTNVNTVQSMATTVPPGGGGGGGGGGQLGVAGSAINHLVNNYSIQNGMVSNTQSNNHLHQHHPAHHQQQPMVQSASSQFNNATSNISSSPNIQQQQHSNSYFLADDIKMELLRKQNLLLNEPPIPESAFGDELPPLPEAVDTYHELYPLETSLGSPSPAISLLVTSTYRATHVKTGEVVCLRRIHSFTLTITTKSFLAVIETWKKVQHANIVQLRQVFSTKAFGDSSLVFVYDYYPGAITMLTHCLNSNNHHNPSVNTGNSVNGISGTARPYSQQMNQRQKLIPEHVLWAYIIQISSALRTLHSIGLACRAVDLSKILVTSGFNIDIYASQQAALNAAQQIRVRIGCPGLADIVFHEAFMRDTQNLSAKVVIAHYQEEDLVNFGKLCLAIICNSPTTNIKQENLMQSLEILSRSYSNDLRSLICYLITPKSATSQPKSIHDIMPMIGARFYAQLDFTHNRLDILESELTKELDNERLFRLMCKLGSINERSELRLDTTWSETGDRYLLKLFRDYIFHQVTEDGQPWLDIAHIVSMLNKLDAGSPEKVCLISRDNQNVLIVSFAELKKCLETAFNELL